MIGSITCWRGPGLALPVWRSSPGEREKEADLDQSVLPRSALSGQHGKLMVFINHKFLLWYNLRSSEGLEIRPRPDWGRDCEEMLESKYRTMKEVLKTLSLASVLCSQVSMTLYNQSAPDSSPQASENMTAVEGEDAIFRLTSQQTTNYISARSWWWCSLGATSPPGPGSRSSGGEARRSSLPGRPSSSRTRGTPSPAPGPSSPSRGWSGRTAGSWCARSRRSWVWGRWSTCWLFKVYSAVNYKHQDPPSVYSKLYDQLAFMQLRE